MTIPTPLRPPGDTARVRVVAAATVEETVVRLTKDLGPFFADRVLDPVAGVREFVTIYVNGEDIRYLDGLATAVGDQDEVAILPAIAGG